MERRQDLQRHEHGADEDEWRGERATALDGPHQDPQASATNYVIGRIGRALVDGIPHVTLQSLTETFTTHPEPAAAWGLLDLGTSIAWRAHGRDPVSFSMPAAGAARRWIAPLPPFDTVPPRGAPASALEPLA